VVPTISASVPWEIGGTSRTGLWRKTESRQQFVEVDASRNGSTDLLGVVPLEQRHPAPASPATGLNCRPRLGRPATDTTNW
jgi:hypothetical protein